MEGESLIKSLDSFCLLDKIFLKRKLFLTDWNVSLETYGLKDFALLIYKVRISERFQIQCVLYGVCVSRVKCRLGQSHCSLRFL